MRCPAGDQNLAKTKFLSSSQGEFVGVHRSCYANGSFETGLDYVNHTSTSLKGLRLQFIVETWVALSHKELDLDFHLPLNFLAEVSTKPRTTATKYCLLRSSGKLYTA